MAKKFDLTSMMDTVSNLDTTAATPDLRLIPIEDIVPNENNFYKLSDLDALADSIAISGILDPLVVMPYPNRTDKFRLISGHRRRKATENLVRSGRTDLRLVPCIVREFESEAMANLMLLLANSTGRKMTDWERSKQAEEIETQLYLLKEEGYEFPGRMREQVAKACQMSASKLGRLKVIREHLIPEYMLLFEKGKLNELAAYSLARLPAEFQQRICKVMGGKEPQGNAIERVQRLYEQGARWEPTLTCPDGKACGGGDRFLRRDIEAQSWAGTCKGEKCCLTCDRVTGNYADCDRMCSKAKAQRKDKKDKQEQQAEKEQVKRAKGYQAETQKNAQRLLKAIDAAGLEDKTTFWWQYSYTDITVAQVREWAAGRFDETAGKWKEARLPVGKLYDPAKTAKIFQCSADFLLGLSDELHGGVSNLGTTEPAVVTNADRIRRMTDEELAQLLRSVYAETEFCDPNRGCTNFKHCAECALEWLKKEAEE